MRKSWLWSVLGAWLSLFALGLVDNARGPVFPDVLKDFSLSDTQGSLFFLVGSIAGLVHNIIFYRFLCGTNPRRLVGIYTLVMAAGALLISHATTYSWMLVACAILGAGFGGLGVGQNAAVQEAPPEHRQRAMGLLHAMYGLSSFAAPLLVSTMSQQGWRLALAVLSLPSVFVGLFVLYEVSHGWNWRQGFRLYPLKRPEFTKPTADEAASREVTAKNRLAPVVAAILIALLVVAETAVSTRFTLLARRDWGLSLETAAGWLAIYFVAMTASRLMVGLFRFRISTARLLYGSLFLGMGCLVLSFFPFGISRDVKLVTLVCFGFPIAMGYPLAMTRIAEIFGAKTQYVTSLCLTFQAGGAMIMHFVLGWGGDHYGLLSTLGTVTIVSLLGAIASFWCLESVKFQRKTTL